MSEWQRVKGLRPKFKFVAHMWVKSVACKIIRESEAQKRGSEAKVTSMFGGHDGKIMDLPAPSACSDQMKQEVLDEAESKFSGTERQIVSLVRKGFACREIKRRVNEELCSEFKDRSDPLYKKCSLKTVSKVRNDFINIARELHFGFRLS
jgi:hypothetical protein